MENIYRVVITEIDPETKAAKEVHVDELYKNVTLIADCADGEQMAEVVLNDSISGMATKIAQGKLTRKAVRLANVFLQMKRDDAENAENDMSRAIMEG
jgi:hypothetical protein